MTRVSTAYELNGRVHQKRRTREALIAAAQDLVAAGETPTVEGAAGAASVSRATAYRYFPTQHALLVAAHPEAGATSLLPDSPPSDAASRLDLVIDAMIERLLATEAQQRTMLRLSLEAAPAERARLPLRQGRGIGWLEEALEPLRADLSAEAVHRLALAIRSATGVEALAWLTDIGGLSRHDAASLMRGSARALFRAAVADGG